MQYFSNYSEEQFAASFDYIESFISNSVSDWSTPPNTTLIEDNFSHQINSLSKTDFCLLLLHSGYIPDHYLDDSSQETLYSKLIESLVCSWAKRIGFNDSYLQTQKSNKEDVTIKINNKIIVCDAKSFRLGRSQAAPNVKDTIKKQAYVTWLNAYEANQRVGGLVTFPSLHDWQKGSEAYYYFTEGNPAIMMLFYEQLAFLLMLDYSATDIIKFLNDYPNIFPTPSADKMLYIKGVKNGLFTKSTNQYDEFMKESSVIIKKKVDHTLSKMSEMLTNQQAIIKSQVSQMPLQDLRELAIDTLYLQKCGRCLRQQENILKFRPHS